MLPSEKDFYGSEILEGMCPCKLPDSLKKAISGLNFLLLKIDKQ